jgi:hypothetical protein
VRSSQLPVTRALVPLTGFADGTGRVDAAAVTVVTDSPVTDASGSDTPEPGFGWG